MQLRQNVYILLSMLKKFPNDLESIITILFYGTCYYKWNEMESSHCELLHSFHNQWYLLLYVHQTLQEFRNVGLKCWNI